jgi:mRNA interferase RelE/StbE
MPISPHLRRQMPYRIDHYSGTASSLYLRQPRQSLNLGFTLTMPSKGRIQIKLRVPEEIVTLIRGCHPQLKRKIRAGLRHIMAEPESGKWLKDEFEGMQSYRISRFRIIYRRSSPRIIDLVAIGPRKTIYEETYRIIKKESHHPL